MRFWTIAADFILIVLAILLFFFWKPVVSLFGACPFYTLTGLWCPGCGATRMFLALKSFDLWSAFRYNPLVFLLLAYLVILLILCNLNLFFGWTAYRKIMNTKALWIIAVASVLFALLRNFPFAPFTYFIYS